MFEIDGGFVLLQDKSPQFFQYSLLSSPIELLIVLILKKQINLSKLLWTIKKNCTSRV